MKPYMNHLAYDIFIFTFFVGIPVVSIVYGVFR